MLLAVTEPARSSECLVMERIVYSGYLYSNDKADGAGASKKCAMPVQPDAKRGNLPPPKEVETRIWEMVHTEESCSSAGK